MDPIMIAIVLMGVISVILILSVVHISGKTDEMAKQLAEIKELLKSIKSGKDK